jgi:NADH-quinone oxidoreductase subunit M
VNGREALVLVTLVIAVLVLGLWPQPLIELMDASVEHLLRHIAVSKL